MKILKITPTLKYTGNRIIILLKLLCLANGYLGLGVLLSGIILTLANFPYYGGWMLGMFVGRNYGILENIFQINMEYQESLDINNKKYQS